MTDYTSEAFLDSLRLGPLAPVAALLFAVFYGLDWVATVPPTVRLTSEAFGRENTGVIHGWIGASHQLGASMAARALAPRAAPA